MPKSRGGTNALKNLMVLCRHHHDEIEGQGEFENFRTPETIKKYNAELIKKGFEKWIIK